jgi:hypothetical protein
MIRVAIHQNRLPRIGASLHTVTVNKNIPAHMSTAPDKFVPLSTHFKYVHIDIIIIYMSEENIYYLMYVDRFSH